MAANYIDSPDYITLSRLINDKFDMAAPSGLNDEDFIEKLSIFRRSKEKHFMVNNAVLENLFRLPEPLGNSNFRTKQPNESIEQAQARLEYQNMNGALIRLFASNQIKPANFIEITKSLATLKPNSPEYFTKLDELEDQLISQTVSVLTMRLNGPADSMSKAVLEEVRLALNIAMSSPMIRKDILSIPDSSKNKYNTKLVEILNTHLNMGLEVEKGDIVFSAAISGVPDLLGNLPEEKKWVVGFATVAKEPAIIEKDSVLRHTLGAVALKTILDKYAIDELGSGDDSFSLINNPNAIKYVLQQLNIKPKDDLVSNQALAYQYLNKRDNIEKVISIIDEESNMDLIVDSLSNNIDIALRFEIATTKKVGVFFTDLTGHEEQVALMVINFADGILKHNNLRGHLKESDSEKLMSSIFNKLTDKLSVTSLKNQDNIDINKVKSAINSHDKIHHLIFDSIPNIDIIKEHSSQKINNQINSAISLALITDDWSTTPNISKDNHFLSICKWGPITPSNYAISDKNLIISAKDKELGAKDKEIVDNLVEWAVGPESFGSKVPIGEKSEKLIGLAKTNTYAASCVAKLFKAAGLDKEALEYEEIAEKLGGSAMSNSTSNLSI
jgi:hypothetical protein